MKVILKQSVPKVGKEGTVVNVADGFARNYLFPRGLAIVAEKKQIEALARQNLRIADRLAIAKKAAEADKARIQGATVKIAGQVGQEGRLFGAVTAQDIVDAIKDQLGLTLERKQIGIVQAIKRLGTFPIDLDLHREVDAVITLVVFDPAAPVAAPAPVVEDEESEDEA